MSIDTFLAQHGASAAPRPMRSAADKVLAEIAALAVLSRDAEQLLRVLEHSLGTGAESLSIPLEKCGDAESPVSVVARRLTNIGILTFVRKTAGDSPSLTATLSPRCSERVREQVRWMAQHGRWLELGAAELVREVAATAGHHVEVATQVHITLAGGILREVDVLACLGQEALLIECKSGHRGFDGVGRFVEVAEALGVASSHTLVLALAVDKEAASDLKAFYPVTIVQRQNLEQILAQRLERMAEQDAGEVPALPSSAAKSVGAPSKTATKKAAPKKAVAPKHAAAKKAVAQPKAKKPTATKQAAKEKAATQKGPVGSKAASKKKAAKKTVHATPVAKKAAVKKSTPPAPRKVVAPELIEAALVAAARAASPPVNLGAVANLVRDDLWCTSAASKAAARTLLARKVFLDKHHETVGDFSTPIHGVQAEPSNST